MRTTEEKLDLPGPLSASLNFFDDMLHLSNQRPSDRCRVLIGNHRGYLRVLTAELVEDMLLVMFIGWTVQMFDAFHRFVHSQRDIFLVCLVRVHGIR